MADAKYSRDGYGDFDELHKYKQYLSDIASYDKHRQGALLVCSRS